MSNTKNCQEHATDWAEHDYWPPAPDMPEADWKANQALRLAKAERAWDVHCLLAGFTDIAIGEIVVLNSPQEIDEYFNNLCSGE